VAGAGTSSFVFRSATNTKTGLSISLVLTPLLLAPGPAAGSVTGGEKNRAYVSEVLAGA
uniref:Uncharacterized protein n=1 Tax=Anopheles quadriannulatus TaxID=34691 RepID=A0A182XQN3_ANOQN